MAYTIPVMVLQCNIGFNLSSGATPRLSDVACNLMRGRSIPVVRSGTTLLSSNESMHIALPKLTDVRGPQDMGGDPDQIECPAGTGRFYNVWFVDDVGKGFPNEYRIAGVVATIGSWTPPYP
jgi:hypothetical protein